MKRYLSDKFNKTKWHVQNFGYKIHNRVYNLAKRLEQGHRHNEKKK